jgi:hypothetical protein
VYRSEHAAPLMRIDVSGLPSGMYLINIAAGEEQHIQKLLINNN